MKTCYLCGKEFNQHSSRGTYENTPQGAWEKNTDPLFSLVPWYMKVHSACLLDLIKRLEKIK